MRTSMESKFRITSFPDLPVILRDERWPEKPEVAKAQLYFIELTRRFELYIQNSEELERLLIRDELKEGNKSLAVQRRKPD